MNPLLRPPLECPVAEPLESRIAPAVVSLASSVLAYAAGAGVANDVTVLYDLTSNNYAIQDLAETIVLDPTAQAAGFAVSANGHMAIGPAIGLTSLTVDLADKNDEITIIASATPMTIHGGDGDDHFDVGANSLLFISGEVTIDGGAGQQNFLDVSDTQTGLAGTYSVTNTAISRSDGPLINFSGISDLLLKGGLGANTFRIESLSGGQSLDVEGSDGFDTFIIGNTANSLASIGGALNIVTQGGNDILIFNDQSHAGTDTSTLTSTTFTSDDGPAIGYEALAGDTVVLNMRPSPVAVLFVPSLASGVEYVLNAGANGSPIHLGGGGADSLGALLGHATIVGNNASTLVIDESAGNNAHEYLIGASTFSRDGVEIVSFNGLQRAMLLTGSGNDLIDAGASLTRFDLDAGAGDDRIIAPARGAFVNAGPGTDTLTITHIPGDVTLDEFGLSGPAFGAGLAFPADAPEFVKLGGDNAPNTITVEAFPGFAILDGGGGGDTLIGGDVNLTGKSATFTDPAGNIVTIRNDVARFNVNNVDFLPSGLGAALSRLDLTAGPKNFSEANLSITAIRGPLGGDGRTAVGQIIANGFDLASVVVDGDLAALEVGDTDVSTPALGLLQANSLGLFGNAYLPDGTSPDFFFTGKAARVEVATDFAGGVLNISGGATGPGKLGSLIVGGNFAAHVYTTGRIGSIDLGNMIDGSSVIADSGARIAALTIRHEMRLAEIYADGAIETIDIGGNVTGSRIIARGSDAPASPDAALALGSVHIGGSLTDSFIGAGFDRTKAAVNPDVTIGPVVIEGNFNRSDLVAGINSKDGVFGNGDDEAATPAAGPFAGLVGGNSTITARIAKVIIGGGVFGAPLFPTTHNAIATQQIGKLKIGGELLTLTDDVDHLPLSLVGDLSATEIA